MKKKNLLLLLLVSFLSFSAYADDNTNEQEDGPNAPPSAPLNQYIVISSLIGVSLAFLSINKKTEMQKNNENNL